MFYKIDKQVMRETDFGDEYDIVGVKFDMNVYIYERNPNNNEVILNTGGTSSLVYTIAVNKANPDTGFFCEDFDEFSTLEIINEDKVKVYSQTGYSIRNADGEDLFAINIPLAFACVMDDLNSIIGI